MHLRFGLALLLILGGQAKLAASTTYSLGTFGNISFAFESPAFVAGVWTEDYNDSSNQQIVCVVGFTTTDHICGSPSTGTAKDIPIPSAPGGTTPGGSNYLMDDGAPTYGAPVSTDLTGLTVGVSYTISFYQASSEEVGSGPKAYNDSWQVYLIPGASSGVYICPVCSTPVNPDPGDLAYTSPAMANSGGVTTNWELEEFTFKATNTSEILEFVTNAIATTGGSFMPPLLALADVTLNTAIPEPSTWELTILGIGVVFAASRLRRRFSARG